MIYKFVGSRGEVEVTAPNENQARVEAMSAFWGPARSLTHPIPDTNGKLFQVIGNPYYGQGLTLVSVSK
jgi:hypothetical protein